MDVIRFDEHEFDLERAPVELATFDSDLAAAARAEGVVVAFGPPDA